MGLVLWVGTGSIGGILGQNPKAELRGGIMGWKHGDESLGGITDVFASKLCQGTLTEGEGSVQLTSSLRLVVL
jgi:hypothetical protein